MHLSKAKEGHKSIICFLSCLVTEIILKQKETTIIGKLSYNTNNRTYSYKKKIKNLKIKNKKNNIRTYPF
jgi:hypothetical protein